jgi:hypothetical protein
MNAGLAKPIPENLVYSRAGQDKGSQNLLCGGPVVRKKRATVSRGWVKLR